MPGGCLEGAWKLPGRTRQGAAEVSRAGLEDTWNLPEVLFWQPALVPASGRLIALDLGNPRGRC